MALTTDISRSIRKLTSIVRYQIQSGTIGDTVTTAATVRSATSVSISATTSFTTADPAFLIGSGGFELISAIGAPNVVQTLTNQLIHFIHPIGTRFVEAVAYPLGKIAKGSAKFTAAKPLSEIFTDVDDAAVGFIDGNKTLGMSFGLYEATAEALQAAFGDAEDVVGAGTNASPFQGAVGDPNAVAALPYTAYRATGLLQGGRVFEVDFLNGRMETSVDSPLDGRDAPPSLAVTVKCAHIIWRVKA